MGAFFLTPRHANFCRKQVEQIFLKKGFTSYREFILGDWTLMLWPKQLIALENWIDEGRDGYVFSVGTIVYKGLGYQNSLRELLKDVRLNNLHFEKLQGAFVVIFFYDGQIRILSDELNVGSVFIDERLRQVSSSFLAMLGASPTKRSLHQLALREKLSTGYIVAPDTLVQGILKATNSVQERISWDGLSFITHQPRRTQVTYCNQGFNVAVDDQLRAIRHKFHQLSELSRQFPPELGLSSGYDSRLLLCLSDQLPVALGVHTHNTDGAHNKESRIASELCQLNGNKIRIIPTQQMKDQPDNKFSAILNENLYYYDGRNSAEMGAFSETYTRTYRVNVSQGFQLGFSGLGGEIFRNYFTSSLPRISFKTWMLKHVYYFGISQHFNNYMETHHHIVNKMNEILGIDLGKWINQFTLRRYYGEIRMPESNGIISNAHNQLGFYLTPFGEYQTILKAYEATPYIGVSGSFEAAMINSANPQLAAVDSNYGYAFSKIPLKSLFSSSIKGYVPDRIWVIYDNLRLRHGWRQNLVDMYSSLCNQNKVMKDIDQVIRSVAPYLDLNFALRDARSLGNLVYVGYLLREFAPYLNLNNGRGPR